MQGQVTCLAANRVAPFSNYLYIGLINPSDSVVVRQKISCKNKGSFAAALPIDPLAAYGIVEGEELWLRALVGNHKTGEAIRAEARGDWTKPEELAAKVVADLRAQGADAILKAVLG